MRFRRIALWAFVDVLGTSLGVALLSVHPKAELAGAPLAAQHIITAEWPVAQYDGDVDLWVVPPSGKPVFFGNRQERGTGLDQDNKGWTDSKTTLPDGTDSILPRAKEMVSLRGLEPGHYDVGVNLYSWHPHGRQTLDRADIPVHVEIVDVNPTTKVAFTKDVVLVLDSQTINVVSFDLGLDGRMTFVDPPLDPVTSARSN